jgi:hypothetical protein
MIILVTTGSPYAWSHPNSHSKPHSWAYAWSHAWSRLQSFAKVRAIPPQKGSSEPSSSSGSPSLSQAYTVPEIDAASGTSTIVLLTGVLLLAGERSRYKRS